jgi:hypothetical protein
MNYKPLSIGDVALALGCRPWQIRRVIGRGLIAEPPRVGPYRVFVTGDLPRIRAALKEAGYVGKVGEGLED